MLTASLSGWWRFQRLLRLFFFSYSFWFWFWWLPNSLCCDLISFSVAAFVWNIISKESSCLVVFIRFMPTLKTIDFLCFSTMELMKRKRERPSQLRLNTKYNIKRNIHNEIVRKKQQTIEPNKSCVFSLIIWFLINN